MRSVLIVSIALITAASAARAADTGPVVTPGPLDAPPAFPPVYTSLPNPTPGPIKAAPAYVRTTIYDWTGFYVGINGGGVVGSADWTSVPGATSGSSSMSSGLVGATVGYNLQTGEPWVLGVELDLDWSDLRARAATTTCAPDCQLTASWLDTTRLRFGWVFDGFVPGGILPYVTGGMALGLLNAASAGAPFGNQPQANFGWTAGAGVEFVITGALRAKFEYLYVDLDNLNCTVACGGGPVSFHPVANVFRAGLNYRLWMN
jgi:opacity protein-like surface antigen